jgi:chromosome partitioning protein
MRTIAIANQKGGVGKTTVTLTLGRALANRGRRVLLVDLDPQMSLTIALGVDDTEARSIADVIGGATEGTATIGAVTRDLGDGLHLVPSDLSMAANELGLTQRDRREYILFDAIANVRSYDYLLIDCPPALSLLTINALAAAGDVLIPFIPEYLGLRGLALFMQTIERARRINPDLRVLGCLPMLVSHTKEHAQMIEAIGQRWPLAPVHIGRSIRVAEAARSGESVITYDASNPQAAAFNELAAWVESQTPRGKRNGKA